MRELGGDQYLSKYDTGNLAAKLGNTPQADGDGQSYRGRGLIQITGRNNYRRAVSALFGDERLLLLPELLEQPQWAAESAAWFWEQNGLNALADRDEFNSITRRINGGLNGLQDRLQLWARARAVLCRLRIDPDVLPALAVVLLAVLAGGSAALAWQFQDGVMAGNSRSRPDVHAETLNQLTLAAATQQQAEQDKRLALEQRLSASEQTHYRALAMPNVIKVACAIVLPLLMCACQSSSMPMTLPLVCDANRLRSQQRGSWSRARPT